MVDENISKKLIELMDDSSKATLDDFLLIIEYLKQLATENEDIIEELEELDDLLIQMAVTDRDAFYWLKVEDGKLDAGQGEVEDPSFTLSTEFNTMLGVLTGELDAASTYMAGDITVVGNLQEAMSFVNILEIAMESFEDLYGGKIINK